MTYSLIWLEDSTQSSIPLSPFLLSTLYIHLCYATYITQVDTSVLTGEPFPRKVPNEDAPGDEGSKLWSGCNVKQGTAYCLVEKTGLETEVGNAARLMQQNSGRRVGLLESKILGMAKVIILSTLLIVVAIVVVQVHVRKQDWRLVVVRALSLTIAAVPVAIPLVLQVMMAVSKSGPPPKRLL